MSTVTSPCVVGNRGPRGCCLAVGVCGLTKRMFVRTRAWQIALFKCWLSKRRHMGRGLRGEQGQSQEVRWEDARGIASERQPRQVHLVQAGEGGVPGRIWERPALWAGGLGFLLLCSLISPGRLCCVLHSPQPGFSGAGDVWECGGVMFWLLGRLRRGCFQHSVDGADRSLTLARSVLAGSRCP